MLSRRRLLAALLAARGSSEALATSRPPASSVALAFPRDFGAHPQSRIEWWYATGALEAAARTWGFQITFFRATTGIAGAETSAFRADQLVFAHAAVTDLAGARLLHDQRIARRGFGIADASTEDTRLVLRGWRLERAGGVGASRYRAVAASETAGFRFDLALEATQAVLLQGVEGLSQKGPDRAQSSLYYSEPQLAVRGTLALGRAAPIAVTGRAWLDHEWSDSLLDASAVGWDWIGMNLDDGATLTAFRLRRADGTTLWAGGSHRAADARAVPRNFTAAEVAFQPMRIWTSPATRAAYPVQWQVTTPVGRFEVVTLQDDQELDSRNASGSVYWEGLSKLLDASGRPVGRGYLEMTGYVARLVL